MAISLATLSRGKVMKPPRMIVYGDHKIGKSEFAASAPNPIFIDIEGGLDHIDTASWRCTSYDDVIAAMNELYTKEHGFETVVIDSVDWLERLIFAQCCAVGGKGNIEEFGYGKGYVLALAYWGQILEGLNALRDVKGMAIICLAHHQIKRFDAPDSESYDQYRIKLNDKAGSLMQEWADIIGFAAKETFVKKSMTGQTEINRAVGSGKHLLYLQGKPSFQAGNRYNLPASVELRWPFFIAAFIAAAAKTFTPPVVVEQPAQPVTLADVEVAEKAIAAAA